MPLLSAVMMAVLDGLINLIDLIKTPGCECVATHNIPFHLSPLFQSNFTFVRLFTTVILHLHYVSLSMSSDIVNNFYEA